ncbi:MAG TPA: serine/threonine-protein kinase [Gemmatimonadales bacterium]|nr:serine/threonine-protein kinase [Gemmatimonadales bacterium]
MPLDSSPFQGILADRYVIEREIGRGAMATVYLARDQRHQRPVAVKVLRPELARLLGSDRFLREIRIAASLQHPHVLPLYDSGEAEGFLYYVMPYIAGSTLRARLLQERRLPVAEALGIARDTADALAHAHEAGIVHRDIKPENILLEAGHAVVADFGIARAIGAASVGGTAGLPIGTPGYMSPEQLTAQENIDGRSDVYSLGCVLYEMLAGELPTTSHAQAADAGRRTPTRLPSLRLTRPDAPRWLEPVLARALAEAPVERYPDAQAFAAALAGGPVPLPVRQRRWARPALVVTVVAVAGALGFGAYRILRPAVALEEDTYVVLPLLHRGSVAPRALNGDLCATMLYDALSRWPDIAKVNSLNVSNLLQRRGALPRNLDEALTVTRMLRAGRLLWGEVYELGGKTYVRMYVYGVRRPGKASKESLIEFPSEGGADVSARFASAIDTLVGGGTAGGIASGTRSFAALKAYTQGDSALRQWDLPTAQERFEAALAADAGFGWANLKLAQVSEWRSRPAEAWRGFAQRAADSSSGLPAADRLEAAALVDLADARYVESCAKYRELIKRDARDFMAWFGLGECQQQDELVLTDRSSPTGFRFRSSYQAALDAYLKALALVPAAHRAFQEMIWARLNNVLFTQAGQYRAGYLAGSDTRELAAFPGLDHDTLSFVPGRWPPRVGAAAAAPFTAALAKNKRIMEQVSRRWIADFPSSASAWRARALALERSGALQGQTDESALGAIRRARALAATPAEARTLSLSEVRMRIKTLDAAGARLLAESVLAANPDPTAREALLLAPLAGLIGRLQQLAALLERGAAAYGFGTAAGQHVEVPATLAGPALRLDAFASLGSSADTVRALEFRLTRGIAEWRGRDREGLRQAVLEPPATFGFPSFGPRPIHLAGGEGGSYLFALQRRLARGDSAGVHRSLVAIERNPIRLAASPGDISMDAVYQEVWLLLAVGDTAEALGALDRTLNNLSLQWELPFTLYHGTTGLVGAMALRAQLAARARDSSSAQRWAQAVLELRAKADAGTTPDLNALRPIAAFRPGPR